MTKASSRLAQKPVRHGAFAPWQHFTARQWARMRQETPLVLSEDELAHLRGRGEVVSLREVEQIYLPLSRLLNLHVHSAQGLYRVTHDFLHCSASAPAVKTPYIIGIAGSVAVGKSTTARILRTLLSRWDDHPQVALITTDGFLYPAAHLRRHRLMERKGWPESFDRAALLKFVAQVKSGSGKAYAPVYSHAAYDIIPGKKTEIARPDILIIEGLNVLQGPPAEQAGTLMVSDFFDFSIYLDAAEPAIRQWYIDRFMELRHTAFRDPAAYFHQYAKVSAEEALAQAEKFWDDINAPNLRRNILPTRERADLILHKDSSHAIREVWMRKL